MKIAYVYDAFGNEERSGSPSFLNEVMMTKSIKDKSTKKVVNDADGKLYDPLLNKPLAYSDAGGYGDPDKERRLKMLAGVAQREAEAARRKAAAARKRPTHSCKTSNCGRCATEQDVARNLADTKEAKENEAKRAEEKRKAEIEYWKAYEQQQKEYWAQNKPMWITKRNTTDAGGFGQAVEFTTVIPNEYISYYITKISKPKHFLDIGANWFTITVLGAIAISSPIGAFIVAATIIASGAEFTAAEMKMSALVWDMHDIMDSGKDMIHIQSASSLDGTLVTVSYVLPKE